eukprot:jgi/Botrbrau1/3752/Bobra.0363s0029.1
MGSDGATETACLVFCRVCHEDEHPSNCVKPCACSGSMQYAHRSCIQDWINEKGDKTCEVCCCPYSGSYDDPPARKRRHFDLPDAFDADAYRDLVEDEEQHGECQVWGMSCAVFIICVLVLVQLLGRWPSFGSQWSAEEGTGESGEGSQEHNSMIANFLRPIRNFLQVTITTLVWISGWLLPVMATGMLVGGISLLVYLCLPPFWYRIRHFLRKHVFNYSPSRRHGAERGRRQRQGQANNLDWARGSLSFVY